MLGLSGEKNHVKAGVYGTGDNKHKDAIFTAEGSWSKGFEIKDGAGQVIDRYDVAAAKPSDFRVLPEEEQDQWESRKAWQGVIKSIHSGDMQGVANSKSELENAQRELRKRPDTSEDAWECLFFRKESSHPLAEKLLSEVGQSLDSNSTCGVWRFNSEAAGGLQRPWRGDLTPFGQQKPTAGKA